MGQLFSAYSTYLSLYGLWGETMSVFCSLWFPRHLSRELAHSRCPVNNSSEGMTTKVATKETCLQLIIVWEITHMGPKSTPHILHLRQVVSDEACTSRPSLVLCKASITGFPWPLVWSLSSAHGEPCGQEGGFRCSPQSLRLMWPSDHPSILQGLCSAQAELWLISGQGPCPEAWKEGK